MENLNEKKLEEISGGNPKDVIELIEFLGKPEVWYKDKTSIKTMNEDEFEAYCKDKKITNYGSKLHILIQSKNINLYAIYKNKQNNI